MIDIHAHILPAIDDGASDWEEAERMLRKAYDHGIRTIVATPHAGFYGSAKKLEQLSETKCLLQKYARTIDLDYQLLLGQELFYRDELAELLSQGKVLTLNETRNILVEFQPQVPFSYLYQGIRKLISYGYTPVLAHMERYDCLKKEEYLFSIKDAGCLFQMNCQSLTGNWWKKEVRWCREQILKGNIDCLATDMHGMTYRSPDISEPLKWLKKHCTEKQIHQLTVEVPETLIR